MQYRLRTLLIVLALGPVALAGAWFLSGAILDFLTPERIQLPQTTPAPDRRAPFGPGDIE